MLSLPAVQALPLWYDDGMTIPSLSLTTKDSPSEGSEYVRILLTWQEVLLVKKALKYYCFTARPGFRELTPSLGEHTFALQHILDQYFEDIFLTYTHKERFSFLFPAFFTVQGYRVISELLCLYVDPSLVVPWQREAKQSLEKKLEAVGLAVAIVEAEGTLRSAV